jgi:hypothetical protein
VVLGAVSAHEVAAQIDSMGATIPPDLWRDLKTAGLLASDAPVPT